MNYKIYKWSDLNIKMWITKIYGVEASWSSKFSEAMSIECKGTARDIATHFGGEVFTVDPEYTYNAESETLGK